MPPKGKNNGLRRLRVAYQELHSELVKAYWNADDRAAKSAIQELSGEIYEFLSWIESESFFGKSDDLKRCRLKTSRISSGIEKSRKQIEKTVKAVKTASRIADAMDKALDASAKLLV